MAADPLSCFKAYDIRGRVPLELNLELARHIGLAFAAEFAPRTVCVGHDMRLSSRDLALVLMGGLRDGGAGVIDIGLCGTEEVYHATFSQGFDGGIMITASHNPADWNGMKLVRKDAVPVSADSGLFALRDRILAGNLPVAERRGESRSQSFRQEYIELLLSFLGQDAPRPNDRNAGQRSRETGHSGGPAPLTIVANAGNGCAFLPLHELIPRLPCTFLPLYPEPDGAFPHGVPNPLLPENRAITSEAVLRHKADLGLAWDGDFDRCFFFDEQGEFVEGCYIVGLLAETLLAEHPGEKILHDPRLIWNTQEKVLAAGGIPVEGKSGHAFMKERMRAENALYGGETSAHHYFRDFSYCDSGMIAWLVLYRLISRTGKPLSLLVRECRERYPVSGEINRTVTDAEAVLAAVQAFFEPSARDISLVDGLSMDFGDWRFNLRRSNTEPLLRLNVESRGNAALMQAKRDELLAMMR